MPASTAAEGEEVIGWERPRGEAPLTRRVLDGARPFVIGVIVVGIGMALLFTESQAAAAAFWREHPVATNLVTEMVLALGLVFGLERILEMKSRRRWRSSALILAEEFERSGAGIEEIVSSHVLDYCQRAYGKVELPDEVPYFEVLLKALRDPSTWAADEDSPEVPPLMEWLRSEKVDLEERFSRWAPLLFSDPGLAPFAVAIPPLLRLNESIVRRFEELQPERFGQGAEEDLMFMFVATPLATQLPRYAQLRRDLLSQISVFRTGQPLRVLRVKARSS